MGKEPHDQYVDDLKDRIAELEAENTQLKQRLKFIRGIELSKDDVSLIDQLASMTQERDNYAQLGASLLLKKQDAERERDVALRRCAECTSKMWRQRVDEALNQARTEQAKEAEDDHSK